MKFEWDENKAQINIEKHKVSFEEASTVFYDEDAILFDDPDHSVNEDRFNLIGISASARLLIVCHCIRGNDDIIRIISARKATKEESRQYTEINESW